MLRTPARLLLGAVVGILVLSSLHPQARPVLTSALRTLLHGPLREPQIFAPRNARPLAVTELEAAATKEPENAFWKSRLATAYLEHGNRTEAVRTWILASRCNYWNDFTNEESVRIITHLEQLSKGDWAYFQLAAIAQTGSMPESRTASRLLEAATGAERTELLLATYRYGRLIRDFSRRLGPAREGAQLVLSPQARVVTDGSGRSPMVERFRFAAELRRQGRVRDAEQVEQAFLECEGWPVLESPWSDWEPSFTFQTIIPAAFVTGLVGLLALLCARFQVPQAARQFLGRGILPLAIGAGLVSYGALHSLSFTLLVTATIAFQGFRMKLRSVSGPPQLPPTVSFVCAVLATLVMLYCVAVLRLMSREDFPLDDTALLAVCVLCTLAVVSRAASWTTRESALVLLTKSTRTFGHACLIISGVTIAVGLPLITIWDAKLKVEWERMRLNEAKYAWEQLGR